MRTTSGSPGPTMDLVFSPELLRSMATRAGVKVVEVEAGHIPHLHVLASWRQSS